MREIKFRGKRIDDGKWEQGYLINDNEIRAINESLNIWYDAQVDEFTIGQFTGLYDKNGKEIYEGDILKLFDKWSGNTWYAKVEFGNPYGEYSWGWEFVYIKGDKVNTDCLLWVEMEETGAYCEVIGNIYDNPELIKE